MLALECMLFIYTDGEKRKNLKASKLLKQIILILEKSFCNFRRTYTLEQDKFKYWNFLFNVTNVLASFINKQVISSYLTISKQSNS